MPPPGGRWSPPTWAEAYGVAPLERLRCPGCRRQVRAQDVRDLRMVAVGQEFGCDGCLTRLERSGVLSPLEYATAAGAPAHILGHLRAKDARLRLRLGLPPAR